MKWYVSVPVWSLCFAGRACFSSRAGRRFLSAVLMWVLRFQASNSQTGQSAGSIKELTDSVDIQLVYQDKIWAVITNWTSRRFKGNPKIYDNTHWPEKTVLSDIHGKTWASFTLSGDDLQDRKSMMSNYLPSEERKEYDRLSPMKKRTWLAGRIVAKDMLRSYLWEEKMPAAFFQHKSLFLIDLMGLLL